MTLVSSLKRRSRSTELTNDVAACTEVVNAIDAGHERLPEVSCWAPGPSVPSPLHIHLTSPMTQRITYLFRRLGPRDLDRLGEREDVPEAVGGHDDPAALLWDDNLEGGGVNCTSGFTLSGQSGIDRWS